MMRKILLGLLMVSGMQSFGETYNVFFDTSWVDGVMKYSQSDVYISVVGDEYPSYLYPFTAGSSVTFRAAVLPGHEIAMWSRGAPSETTDPSLKHFSTVVESTSDTYVWAKMPSKDQSLAVHQDWLKYDVKYDGNGATSGTAETEEDVIYTNQLTLAANPFAKTGHSFAAWKRAEDPSQTFADKATVTGEAFGLSYTNKSVTLVAQWTTNDYVVTLDANGGTFSGGGTTRTRTVTFGKPYGDFPTDLDRGGYTFEKSWTNSAGRTVKATDTMNIASNHTLYAVWKSVGGLTITTKRVYDDDGANGSVSEGGSWMYGSKHTLKATPSTGSHSAGWTKDDPNGEIVSTDQDYEIEVLAAATYYAHFALDEHTVTFNYKDAQGNDVSTNQVVKYGHAATPPVVSNYPHYAFEKWDSSDYKSVKGDLIVNAVYQSTILDVTFDPRGGSVTTTTRQYDKGDLYGELPVPIREGYDYGGLWWTGETAGTPVGSNTVVSVTGTQVLYAHWTAKQYVVTFDPNGGTITTGTGSKTVTYGSTYGTLNGASREGYDFDGWHTPDNEKVTSASTVEIAQDHVLTAKWTAKSWWVTLDARGGTVDPDEIYVTFDQPYSGLADATWNGYDFLGWWTSSTGGAQIKNGQRVKDVSITRLYAHWEAKTYTVTFDPRGGSVSETSREVKYQSTYGGSSGTLPTPTKTGYDFQGWYTDPSGSSRVYANTTYSRTSDQTLYAQWRAKTYSVKFEQNGGTSGYMSNQTFTWDVAQDLTANAYGRTGYAFRGWGETADTATVRYVDRQNVSNLTENATVRLYALWSTNSYTISFDGGGGLGAMVSIQAKYDTAVKLPKNTFTFGVNTFKGWRGSNGKDYDDEAVVSNLTAVANGIVTLTAKWSDDYVVRFMANGATNTVMANQNIPVNERTPLRPNAYVRSGYTYMGWATNQVTALKREVAYRDGESVTHLGESGTTVDLFAVWSNNAYRVRFHPNGGEGVPFERTFTYDVAQNLPGSTAFSKDGQVLAGWTTDPTNVAYMVAGSSVSNLTATAGATVSLFAKWASGGPVTSELAIAADSNLELTANPSDWCSVVKGDKGYPEGNDDCIELKPLTDSANATLRMAVVGTGKLTFYYKRNCKDDPEVLSYLDEGTDFSVAVDGKEFKPGMSLTGTPGQWWKQEYAISNVQSRIEWFAQSESVEYFDYSVRLDGISWIPDKTTVGVTFRLNDGTPAPADIWSNATYAADTAIGALPVLSGEGFAGWSTNTTSAGKIDASWIVPAADVQLYAVWDSGEHPVPTQKDAPSIGGFAPAAGGFSLSFASDGRFDYRLLSTLSLTPPIEWTPDGAVKPGTGGVIEFAVPAAGDGGSTGQKFFKVEVLRRK